MSYEPVIGLEVHAQLLTESKIFCGCSTRFGAEPNANTCPVCTGFPGVLPVLNRKVVEFALRAGLATHCQIARASRLRARTIFIPICRRAIRSASMNYRFAAAATSIFKPTALKSVSA